MVDGTQTSSATQQQRWAGDAGLKYTFHHCGLARASQAVPSNHVSCRQRHPNTPANTCLWGNDRADNFRNDLLLGHLAAMHCSNLEICVEQVTASCGILGRAQSHIFAGHVPLAVWCTMLQWRLLHCTFPPLSQFMQIQLQVRKPVTDCMTWLWQTRAVSAGCNTVFVLRVSQAVVI